jgi:hypothetical protein
LVILFGVEALLYQIVGVSLEGVKEFLLVRSVAGGKFVHVHQSQEVAALLDRHLLGLTIVVSSGIRVVCANIVDGVVVRPSA